MYTSNFTQLMQTLHRMRRNDPISITLRETEKAGFREPWQARLSLVKGRFIFCQVWSSVDGRKLLAGEEAIHWLASLPHLTWEMEPLPPQLTSPRVSSDSPLALPPPRIPHRIPDAEQRIIHSWSREQWRVFALIDGSRSTEKIADMLGQPPEVVERIVEELRLKAVIAFDR